MSGTNVEIHLKMKLYLTGDQRYVLALLFSATLKILLNLARI